MARDTKSLLKSVFPAARPLQRWMRSVGLSPRKQNLQKIFSDIYVNNAWANDESVSGGGSTLARTEAIRKELPDLLQSLGAKSLLDAACGDFNWMRQVNLSGIEYLGVDIVSGLIAANQRMYAGAATSFVTLDITGAELPKADVILCRDCLIHLSFDHGLQAINNFRRSGSTFLLATTHSSITENLDIGSGAWRNINLQLPPYSLPQPLKTIVEDSWIGKDLSLWRLN